MSSHTFHTEQFLPVDIQSAWNFFSSPANLSTITPPELDFKILTELSGEPIYEGMHVSYTVKPVFGIPLKWETELFNIKPLLSFTDRQVKGPYRIWQHTHTFVEQNGGILMTDSINYSLPFGFIGKIAHSLFIRKKIETIFNYRKTTLEKLFNS